MTVVLDASALLAYVLDEPGAAAVEEAMLVGDSFLSTVNEAEVLTRLVRLDETLAVRIADGGGQPAPTPSRRSSTWTQPALRSAAA